MSMDMRGFIYEIYFAGYTGGDIRKYMNNIWDTYVWRGTLRDMLDEGGI